MILHAYIDGATKGMANTDQHYKHFIKMNICFILVDTDNLMLAADGCGQWVT